MKLLRVRFPLNSTRFKNMIEDYNVPIDKTLKEYGVEFKDLENNIKKTVNDFKNSLKCC